MFQRDSKTRDENAAKKMDLIIFILFFFEGVRGSFSQKGFISTWEILKFYFLNVTFIFL